MKLRELNILLFSAFAFFMLAIRNGDVLYTLSEQSLFVPGHSFWEETTATSGVAGWLGCFLTQFLHIPWLGALLLILLWVGIYYAAVRAFSLKGVWTLLALIPLTVLLCQEISHGYHVFYLKSEGVAFVPTLYTLGVALLLLLLRVLLLRKMRSLNVSLPKYVAIAFFLLAWAALVAVVFHYDYSDENYHHDLRMASSMDECRWDDVLTEFEQKDGRPTNLMVIYKNIALQHTGRITDMFTLDNCCGQPYVSDSLTVHISQLAAPMIYYQVGLFNFAYRWAMENSVQYGLSVANLKMMARCAIWNGELELADKYLNLLRTTLFYKDWAAEHAMWMHDAHRFWSHPEYKAIVPLIDTDADVLDYDNSLCQKYILDHFSSLRTERPGLEDFALCVSLWTESVADFAEQLEGWLERHPHEPLPTLYQEAALLISQMEGAPAWLSELNYDAAVRTRFQQFMTDAYAMQNLGQKEQDMAKQLRPQYGTTYWWYYYFYTDFQIY